MKLLKSSLLGTAAGFAAVAGAQAADLPVKKAAPIEYVRVCGAYGAGFFYIPGTDTCLRVSGRARFEAGYGNTYSRGNGTGGQTTQGDSGGYIGLLRFNMDARTQTGYGTLRAFVRLEAASRTGATQSIRSGTQERIGRAFAATGQDQVGRDQQFMNVDKAFIQFAGLTAGRASSFFDFYAHDFEIMGSTSGSDVSSTNLIAYTYTGDGGFSATVSAEDPLFRRNGIYSQEGTANVSGTLGTPSRVFNGLVGGVATFNTVDIVERQRMPDFVGVLRYDQPWGSLQLSGASHELNTGDFNFGAGGLTAAQVAAGGLPAIAAGAAVGGVAGPFAVTQPGAAAFIPAGTAAVTRRPSTDYGFAVQAGAKFNLPFIAPGDGLYLQAAYDQGATLYAGSSAYNGSYITNISTINGAPFNQYIADATLNPFTGKIQQSESYSVVASFLHYWAPEWRSAFFGSYSAINFASGARAANAIAYGNFTPSIANAQFTGNYGQRSYALSPVLRDNYQYVAGASLIWSPVKDLDIGVEGLYTRVNLRGGQVVDQTQAPLVTARQIDAGAAVKTVSGEDTWQGRFRVQRDF